MRHQWEAVFLKGFCVFFSASTSNIARIEEMERLLKQAHAEKTRLLESRVGLIPLCQRPGMWWFKMPCLQASISSGTLEYSLYLSWPSFLFGPCHTAYGILVPQPGLEPTPLAVKVLTTGQQGVPLAYFHHWSRHGLILCICFLLYMLGFSQKGKWKLRSFLFVSFRICIPAW